MKSEIDLWQLSREALKLVTEQATSDLDVH